jgi:hypothetical protein
VDDGETAERKGRCLSRRACFSEISGAGYHQDFTLQPLTLITNPSAHSISFSSSSKQVTITWFGHNAALSFDSLLVGCFFVRFVTHPAHAGMPHGHGTGNMRHMARICDGVYLIEKVYNKPPPGVLVSIAVVLRRAA